MPTFQILLHTSDIYVEVEDDAVPCIGFFTNRRATAPTSEEAFQKIMEGLDTDPEMQDIFQKAHDRGLRPKTSIVDVHLIPWWKTFFPWKPPGLIFYVSDEDAGSEQT